jgi:propanol-preferring alcohol dehydrogenase
VSFAEIAPVLCAGVTVYKGLKVTDTKPGDWMVVSGIGGLGHMAVQYAVVMGLHVIAVDVDDAKLRLAERLGAALTVNAATSDPVAFVKRAIGGAHGVLVTAVSTTAFAQGLGMVRRGGTMSLTGLPPGDFPLSIFDTVLNGITVRGSIVGTRLDLQEALDFAALGKVRATVETAPLERINDVFDRMRTGSIEGRVVLDINAQAAPLQETDLATAA